LSQHDLSIANQGFPAFRSDLNDALQALGSMQSGTSAPATTYANMLWYDTTNNIVKMRNEDNDAWISLFTLDQSGDLISEISAGKFIGTDTTDASSTTAAAIKTAGGLAVAKKLYVGTGGAVVEGLTVGKGAGSVATNTAVGASALAANTTGALGTSVGYRALYSNTTGDANSAYGYGALYSSTTGSNNTAIGEFALQANTTASNNTAVGYQAGYTNSTGQYGTFVGHSAGYASTGNANTMIGYQAGQNTTGTYNTFCGIQAGQLVTSGAKNTILGVYNGNQGGLDIRTASNYIVLSDGDGNPRGIFDNNGSWLVGTTSATFAGVTLAQLLDTRTRNSGYGFGIIGNASNTQVQRFFYDTTAVGSINVSGSATTYSTSSDYRLKENVAPMTGALSVVQQLKPCTYNWKVDGSNGQGFIAHELQAVVPECVVGTKDAVDAEGNPVYQGIDTSFLVATLTAAIKELNAKVDAQAAEIAALKGQP